MGVKLVHQSAKKIAFEDLFIKQWEAYELQDDIPAIKSLQALLQWMHENKLAKLTAKTQMIIAPPYTLKIADALITNFHQPGSTLLLLVAAIIGEDWKRVYNYALKNDFRFLSYGDGCLLFPGGE
jgi:S-adenosylmethionine:tRNA ribosyltransferase-isomerase